MARSLGIDMIEVLSLKKSHYLRNPFSSFPLAFSQSPVSVTMAVEGKDAAHTCRKEGSITIRIIKNDKAEEAARLTEQ